MLDDRPTLLLIRHGSTDWNSGPASEPTPERIRGWANPSLNADGKAEASRAAKALSDESLSKIYTSDLNRAAYLAAQIYQKNEGKPPLKATKDLRPWNVGKWAGELVKEVMPKMLVYQLEKPTVPAPGGEAFNDFLKRFLPYFEDRLEEAKKSEGAVILVSHTRNLRAADAWLKAGMTGLETDKSIFRAKDHIKTGNAIKLTWNEGKWRREEVPLGDKVAMKRTGTE